MFLGLNNEHGNAVVVDVVDDAVVGSDMARVGDVVAAYERLGMAKPRRVLSASLEYSTL